MKNGRRIGILGGTFNPVHNGHLAMAKSAVSRYDLKKVIFIPTALPPHKSSAELVSGRDRLEMLKLALGGHPEYEISEIELKRGGKSYTVDTVHQLKERLGADVEIHLIIGADNLLEIAAWREIDELVRLGRFIIVTRPGFDLTNLVDRSRELAGKIIEKDQSNLLPLTVPVSSSEVRSAVREGGDIKEMVPPAVAEYIRSRGLYTH